MGLRVGARDGGRLGTRVDAREGVRDGRRVGARVGERVGASVGAIGVLTTCMFRNWKVLQLLPSRILPLWYLLSAIVRRSWPFK